MVALISGPLLASLFFAADVFWFKQGVYVLPSDYVHTFISLMVVGIVAGAIGAFAIWFAEQAF